MTDKKELTLEGISEEIDGLYQDLNRISGHSAVLKMMTWFIIHHGGDQAFKDDCVRVLDSFKNFESDNEHLRNGIREMAEMLSSPEPFATPSSS
ncbi:hypothetical protein [Zobellella sp. DQSA1]|uniref:hypothetical protein n=1 Tax=Zobellella sp. DQSA1 TaxID=3342386 RepID=UPI0035BED669